MLSSARWVSAVLTFARGAVPIFADVLTFLLLCFRSPAAVAAENLFLRKQLGLYIERKPPRRPANPAQRPIPTEETKRVNLKCYTWRKHCRGLYETPIAV